MNKTDRIFLTLLIFDSIGMVLVATIILSVIFPPFMQTYIYFIIGAVVTFLYGS